MTKKMRWAMPFALLGAVGCSKVELPRVGVGGTAAQKNASKGVVIAPGSAIEQACLAIPGITQMGTFTIAEYAPLVSYIKSQSPFLNGSPDRFKKAHIHAVEIANNIVKATLEETGNKDEAVHFEEALKAGKYRKRRNPEDDLKYVLQNAMGMSEGSPCANAYLQQFYVHFVKQLDPLGILDFGNPSIRSPKTSNSVNADLDKLKPTYSLKSGTVMEVVIPAFLDTAGLNAALKILEDDFKAQNYSVVLLDLRGSLGLELPALAKIWTSLRKSWGAMPIVVRVNRETRGLAAVLAKQFSSYNNVRVIGLGDETYGFGRTQVQGSPDPSLGLQPLSLSIGSEALPIPQELLPGDPDDFRLGLLSENAGLKGNKVYQEDCSAYITAKNKGVIVDKDRISDCDETAVEVARQWGLTKPLSNMVQQLDPNDPNATQNPSQDPQLASGAQTNGAPVGVPGQDPNAPNAVPIDPQTGLPLDPNQPQDPNAVAAQGQPPQGQPQGAPMQDPSMANPQQPAAPVAVAPASAPAGV